MADELDPPIPYLSQIDWKDLDKVTLTKVFSDNTKKKAEMFIVENLDVKELPLRLIEEFDDLMGVSRFNMTDAKECKTMFRECLRGNARSEWDEAREGKPDTMEGFKDAIKQWIGSFLDVEDFQEEKSYLLKARKPWKFSVPEHVTRLKHIVRLMKKFPGAPTGDGAVFDELGLKKTFFESLPADWKTTFDNSNSTLSAMTWPGLIRYFKKLRANDENKRGKPKEKDDKKKGFHQNHNNKSGKKRSFSEHKEKSLNGRGNNKRFKLAKKCPFEGHEAHGWKDCFGNPESKKYKPGFKLPELREGQVDPRKKTKYSDAHHLQVRDAEPTSDNESDVEMEKVDAHHLDPILESEAEGMGNDNEWHDAKMEELSLEDK